MSAQYLLREGCRKRVGTGATISLWEDAWLPNFPYRLMTPDSGMEELSYVSDLIDPVTRTWRRDLIEEVFLPEDCNQIISIPLSQGQEDGWVWIFDAKGNYSVKSGHHRAMELWRMENGWAVVTSSSPWRFVWTSTTPEKVKIWHWKAIHGAIPVRQRLIEKHVDYSDICPMCGAGPETVMHLLSECSVSLEVLAQSSLRGRISELSRGSYGLLLEHIGGNWTRDERELWMFLGWLLWDARNKKLWENKSPCPPSIILAATRLREEWNTAQSTGPLGTSNASYSHWQAPPFDMIKINSDGALALNERLAGGGLVARSHQGEVMGMLVVPLQGLIDPFIVEAATMLQGLKWALHKQWKRVCFESDSLMLISTLRSPSSQYRHEVGGIINECRRFLDQFDRVIFTHVRRQGNAVADAIARTAIHATDRQEWELDYPDQFRAIVALDRY